MDNKIKSKVLNYLNLFDSNYTIIIIDEQTIEKKELNVYYYNTKEYLKDKNVSCALAGNNPILFDKKSNKMYYLNPAKSIKLQIKEFLFNKNLFASIENPLDHDF
jgi:aspartate carbamoyltransferase regulatory subunit